MVKRRPGVSRRFVCKGSTVSVWQFVGGQKARGQPIPLACPPMKDPRSLDHSSSTVQINVRGAHSPLACRASLLSEGPRRDPRHSFTAIQGLPCGPPPHRPIFPGPTGSMAQASSSPFIHLDVFSLSDHDHVSSNDFCALACKLHFWFLGGWR